MRILVTLILTFAFIVGCSSNKPEVVKSVEVERKLVEVTSDSEILAFSNWMEKNFVKTELDKKEFSYRKLHKLRSVANKVVEQNFKARVPFKNKYDQTRNQRITMSIFQFSSSANQKVGLETLLNCFPNDCLKVKVGEDVYTKTTPALYIINHLEILTIAISCEDENDDWDEIKSRFKLFRIKDSKIIDAGCGNIKWK